MSDTEKPSWEWRNEVARLREQLAAAEALCAEMTETLQALYDVQNGCPLPKYETDWNAAMKRADRYLHPPKGLQHDGRNTTGV